MNKFWTLFHHPHAGAVLLRTTLALLLLLHGWSKVVHGIGAIEGMVASHGLPRFLAYGVYIGEVAAPLLLLLGVWVTPAALVVAINMLVAVALAHPGHLLSLSRTGGWALELEALYLAGALAVALTAKPGK
ncbi:MAG: DoxX family protein [Acidovorax sp.]